MQGRGIPKDFEKILNVGIQQLRWTDIYSVERNRSPQIHSNFVSSEEQK